MNLNHSRLIPGLKIRKPNTYCVSKKKKSLKHPSYPACIQNRCITLRNGPWIRSSTMKLSVAICFEHYPNFPHIKEALVSIWLNAPFSNLVHKQIDDVVMLNYFVYWRKSFSGIQKTNTISQIVRLHLEIRIMKYPHCSPGCIIISASSYRLK